MLSHRGPGSARDHSSRLTALEELTVTTIAALEGRGDQKVLVLHGWVMDAGVWLPTRALSDVAKFTFAYVDFPGYGTNRSVARLPDSIDAMAEVALNAAADLGWKSYAVVGHSMGATTALRVATLAPAAVSTVVAVSPVSPAGTVLDDETLAMFRGAWNDPAAAVKSVLSPTMTDADLRRLAARNRASMDQIVWDRYLQNWIEPDFFSDLKLYSGPVSLLGGDQDPFVTQEYLAAISEGLPNSSVAAVAGAGHYPMLEAPQATIDAIEGALGSH
jgi:pimeloyl-ACP methyl ester carboxylesterase